MWESGRKSILTKRSECLQVSEYMQTEFSMVGIVLVFCSTLSILDFNDCKTVNPLT